MPNQQPVLGVIVVAAGASTRMGIDKIFTKIAGYPVIYHTLQCFQTHPLVKHICVVVESSKIPIMEQIVAENNFSKVEHICAGGNTRQESVQSGLKELSPTQFVGIHDGARPCINHETITNCITQAQIHGNAITAIPVTDTIKKIDNTNQIMHTIDRSQLWQAQTPQIFTLETLQQSYDVVSKEFTDDSSLLESLNIKIHVSMGDPTNIKITTPGDLIMAEQIIKQSEQV